MTAATALDYASDIVLVALTLPMLVALIGKREPRSFVMKTIIVWYIGFVLSEGLKFWSNWASRGRDDFTTVGAGVVFATLLLGGYYGWKHRVLQ